VHALLLCGVKRAAAARRMSFNIVNGWTAPQIDRFIDERQFTILLASP
jgi:hypothetical protein